MALHNMPTGGGDPRCSMNMLWSVSLSDSISPFLTNPFFLPNYRNADIINTCIVFRSWHTHTHIQFVLSLLAIILLGVFYEYLRVVQQGLDYRIALSLSAAKTRKIRVPSSRSSPGAWRIRYLGDGMGGWLGRL